jgi:hypothetical protein
MQTKLLAPDVLSRLNIVGLRLCPSHRVSGAVVLATFADANEKILADSRESTGFTKRSSCTEGKIVDGWHRYRVCKQLKDRVACTKCCAHSRDGSWFNRSPLDD